MTARIISARVHITKCGEREGENGDRVTSTVSYTGRVISTYTTSVCVRACVRVCVAIVWLTSTPVKLH